MTHMEVFMTVVDRINNANERSTKAHLLALLKDAKSHIEDMEEKSADSPEKLQNEDMDLSSVANWVSSAKQNFVSRFSAMEDDYAKVFDRLEKAKNLVEDKEKRLTELFGIEKSLLTAVGAIEAAKVATEESKRTKDTLKKEHEILVRDLDQNHKRTVLENEQRYKDILRDQEYNQNKKAREWREKFEQEKFEEERRFKIEKQEKIDELDKREAVIEENEEQFVKMKEQVESFPSTLEQAVADATDKLKKRENQSHAFEVRELKYQKENVEKIMQQKIDHLQNVIERLTDEKEDLAEKLEKAQERVQAIATETVKSAKPNIIQSQARVEK